MSSVNINGKTIEVPDGSNVSVVNNKVYVNGLEWKEGGTLSGVVRVELSGDIKEVKTDASLHVHGDIQGSAFVGGSLKCKNINGHVKVNGSVHCGDVSGSVTANGSVTRL